MDNAQCRCGPCVPAYHPWYERWFPVPEMIAPRGAGVDISDSSMKWLSLKRAKHGFEVETLEQIALEPGLVVEGIVRNPVGLGAAIRALREQAHGELAAHVALPEETAYVFTMFVPDVRDRAQVLQHIEFELEDHVPLKADQVIYDYDIIALMSDGVSAEVSVSVFPKTVIEGYVAAFDAAGVRLLSLELEARSIARSVLAPRTHDIVFAVDFGRARTGIMIFNSGIPIFTSTVSVGGDSMTKVIMETLKIDEAQAEQLKNEEGLNRGADKQVAEAVLGTAASLADEIARHFEYWDSRRDESGRRVTPISSVILTGGSSNLKGLDEYIAGRVKAPTARADVWRNVCSYDHYIPPIDAYYSLGLSTAVGLALRGIS